MSNKQGSKKRKIKESTQVKKKSQVEEVVEKNRKTYDHFNNLTQIASTQDAEVGFFEYQEETLKIGALTNFEQFENKEDEEQSKEEEEIKKEEETQGLTIEELEQKKLETFRAEKKVEMEELTAKMNKLKGKNYFFLIL